MPGEKCRRRPLGFDGGDLPELPGWGERWWQLGRCRATVRFSLARCDCRPGGASTRGPPRREIATSASRGWHFPAKRWHQRPSGDVGRVIVVGDSVTAREGLRRPPARADPRRRAPGGTPVLPHGLRSPVRVQQPGVCNDRSGSNCAPGGDAIVSQVLRIRVPWQARAPPTG